MTCCQLAKITNSSPKHHHHGFPVLFSRSLLGTLGEPLLPLFQLSEEPSCSIPTHRHSDTTVGPGYDHHALACELNHTGNDEIPTHKGSWKEAAPARGRGVVGGFECVLLWGVGRKLRAQVAKSCPQNTKAAPHNVTFPDRRYQRTCRRNSPSRFSPARSPC